MPLFRITCEEHTINNFCDLVKRCHPGRLSSLEESKERRDNSIVVGKIVKVVSKFTETDGVTILVKEVLPNLDYGQKFYAVTKGKLAKKIDKLNLQTGDRLAFCEPNIFVNPSFQQASMKHPKYTLEIESRTDSLVWFSYKKYVLVGKNASERNQTNGESVGISLEQSKSNKVIEMSSPNKKELSAKNHIECQRNQTDTVKTRTQMKNITSDVKSVNSKDMKNIINSNTPPDVRQKPHIQLPVNPQIPANSKPLNPRYAYKKLLDIINSVLAGDLNRVNLFGIVHQIRKKLCQTETGKYTIICHMRDESVIKGYFAVHFFVGESSMLEQIEEGDILRLHRVKVEEFNKQADGRVFSSQDIVLFKHNSPDLVPITSAKHITFTEDDNQKVINLKNLYNQYTEVKTKQIVLLGDIRRESTYELVCQIVSKPEETLSKVILKVTDGSEITHLTPAEPLPGGPTHLPLVTVISVCHKRQHLFTNLQPGDFVLLNDVRAVDSNGLKLYIPEKSNGLFQTLNKNMEHATDIERRLATRVSPRSNVEGLGTGKNIVKTSKEPQTAFNTTNISAVKDGDFIERRTLRDTFKSNKSHMSSNNSENLESVKKSCENETALGIYKGVQQDEQFVKSALPNEEDLNQRILRSKKSQELKAMPCPSTVTCLKKKVVKQEGYLAADIECLESKSKKYLFTANYADLSDATDEASDIFDSLMHFRGDGLRPAEQVVTPANTSFGDLIELVKTKYCSPRKISSQDSPTSQPLEAENHQSTSENGISKCKKDKINTDKLQLPFVKLVKLTDEECRSLEGSHKSKTDDIRRHLRKRTSLETGANNTQLELEDASTVVNMSYQDNLQNTDGRKKRQRLESESTVLRGENENGVKNKLQTDEDNDTDIQITQEKVVQKVSSWLCHPKNRLEADNSLEINMTDIKLILQGEKDGVVDLSSYLTSQVLRTQVFLMEITPDPISDPMDLISGYCYSGCLQLVLYSKIHWFDGEATPYCPHCIKLQQVNELELMFMMELWVMDRYGYSASVVVCREHAETFFNCSARDFLKDPVLRKSRVQLLCDYSVHGTFHQSERPSHVPLLDMSIAPLDSIFCLVNTTLKLPLDL